jgi:hypothetical protein
LSVDRKERGSVLSKLEIESRTPTVKLNFDALSLHTFPKKPGAATQSVALTEPW